MSYSGFFQDRWYGKEGGDLDVVISSRIRLARNLIDFPFPGKMSRDDENAVNAKVLEAVKRACGKEEMGIIDLSALPSAERRVLVEEGIIPQPYSLEPFRNFAMSPDASLAIVPNETDHVRMSAFASGLDLAGPYARLDALDDMMEESLSYAASYETGYVTTELNSMGTGLRASLLLHLPALSDSGLIEKAIKGILSEGLGVRGFYGGEGQSSGALYQISNSISLGESETAILARVRAAAMRLIQYERLAREELAERDRERLVDLVARAYAILRYAHSVSMSECFDLLSRFRLGVALGWIQGAGLSQIDAFYYRFQKASLQLEAGTADDSDKGLSIDVTRARKLRAFAAGTVLQGVD